MRDRLSIHLDNGQSDIREAVTVLRNGGTASQSGLVGITNAAYDPNTETAYIPETIFNVQSTGDSNIRFSSGPSTWYRSCLELLGVGNERASGLHFSYDPQFDNAFVGDGYGYYGPELCVNPGVTDKTVADFSLIRPSGQEGMEFSHISLSERGYVSIGLTRIHEQRQFEANAPLTIAYMCDGHQDSGTISMHEQSTAPTDHSAYGKVYVKPYTVGGRTQALYFKDDVGNETNLVLSQDLDPTDSTDGVIYGDAFGNTYGGWYTPKVRTGSSELKTNTFYGYGAGASIDEGSASNCNVLIGYHTGSGIDLSGRNTVVGCNSLYGYSNAYKNVVIGSDNVSQDGPIQTDTIQDIIVIGRDLYNGEVPDEGVLAIGIGSNPLITGRVASPNKHFTVNDGYLSVLDENQTEFKVSTVFDATFQRNTINIDLIDYNRGGSDYAEDNLKFNFKNEDGLTNTLFQLEPRGNALSNTPNYEFPAETTPFAQLDADFKLKGAIRFQDGTSLSGISDFELLTTLGTSGINKVLQTSNSTNYFVLDYSNLSLAGDVSSNIRTDNTFVAVQLDGTGSSSVGKMSLQGLADYVSSGASSIAENCNIIISNAENELNINAAANTRSVMIGCDVAYGASGQYNSIMIGSAAGANATVSNPSLSTPFNNIFIGPAAGQNSNDTAYAICIGASAGKNSDDATDCVFVGNSAGLDSTQDKSIGIGKFALKGGTSESEGGVGNIEINAGFADGDRLFSNPEALGLDYRVSINKTIAGRTDRRNISIGDGRLSPTAPLEVRYDDTVGHNNNPEIDGSKVLQSWYCNDTLVAYLNCDGQLIPQTSSPTSFIKEGILDGTLSVAGGINSPSTATLSVYENGTDTTENITVTNRDATLGPIGATTYVIVMKMGDEWRPMWVSCP
jgi:hypothetical protein